MKVLLCHVHYLQAGGEDVVFTTERTILRSAGIDVRTLELRTAQFGKMPFLDRARLALGYPDHRAGRALMRRALAEHQPDLVHFHNIYPLLGPGAIAEAHAAGCATVQTLHNYRLSCLCGYHLRDGEICESCRPTSFRAGVLHACYRSSRPQSLLVQRATSRQWESFVHRGTPSLWLALTPFMRLRYIESGAPGRRVLIKSNSVDEGRQTGKDGRRGVFCGGRLSPEKGIVQLMDVWPDDAPPLTVAGAGPLEDEVQRRVRDNVRYVGELSHDDMLDAMRSALVVAMPSVWPEPLSLVALEAFAQGTPVVAFEGWSLGSVVEQVSTHCTVPFGHFLGMARRATEVCTDARHWQALSDRSLRLWRDSYSHDVNRRALLNAYRLAMEAKGRRMRL